MFSNLSTLHRNRTSTNMPSTTMPCQPTFIRTTFIHPLCTKPFTPSLSRYSDIPHRAHTLPKHPQRTIHLMPTMTTSPTNSIPADYTLYFAPTPNGNKVALLLEELQANYTISPIRIGKAGDQFKPDFLKINPNSKIPALVDHTADDITIFESGAILEYLAEKHNTLLPPFADVAARYEVKQWLYWQMAGFGPMLGQFGFFWKFAQEEVPIAKERYLKEAKRLFGVLDERLGAVSFVGGNEYSIADIACYHWSVSVGMVEETKAEFEGFENVKRWQEEIGKREAVGRVKDIPFEW